MLMVILGAGASFDSSPSWRPHAHRYWFRPPLANGLFAPVEEFRKISEAYPKCQFLLPLLENRTNVEEILQQVRERAATDSETKRQLLAIQYYIRDVISLCEANWKRHTCGVINHQTLVNYARRAGDVCFVTFNYDQLIEHALAGIGAGVSSMESYISNAHLKLFKLHGSTNWTNYASLPGLTSDTSPQRLIERAPSIQETSMYRVMGNAPAPEFHAALSQPHAELPALAVPTASKSDFVCPESHIEAFKKCIPQVRKLLTIGWRGTEQHFLALLSENGLQKGIGGLIVCETLDAAALTRTNLGALGKNLQLDPSNGFSEFSLGDGIADFFC